MSGHQCDDVSCNDTCEEQEMPQTPEEMEALVEQAKNDPNFLTDLKTRLGNELLTILTLAEQFDINLDDALEQASKNMNIEMEHCSSDECDDCDSCDSCD